LTDRKGDEKSGSLFASTEKESPESVYFIFNPMALLATTDPYFVFLLLYLDIRKV